MTTPPPDRFTNRYRVLDTLGEGAMGVVYRVADVLDGRAERALKVFKPAAEADDAEARLRFRAEFHAMSRLGHPNTTEVLDYGELPNGTLYIVMELVPGQELMEVIGGRPMPLEACYPVLAQVLQALDYIHARQFLHRDIKAANVRVRPDGVVKVMDFGLMGHASHETSRAVSGTPGYMAPEIPLGGAITPAVDLYAVGCLAYEMLTGTLPFSGSLGEVVRGHMREPPPSLAARRPELPQPLIRLVERLLEKDPARRPPSAGHALEELSAIAGLRATRANVEQQRSFLVASELVGREAELARLQAGLDDALAGRGSALMLGAPAGTGKSRLVAELKLRAQLAGFVVMHGHCHEGGMAPFEALREAIRPALAHGTQEEREQFAAPLAALFPEFGAPAQVRGALVVEPLLAWLGGLSARLPLLLVVDDMHWADQETVDVVNRGIREVGAHRVLCVCTFRDDETPPGSSLWHTLEEGASERLSLGPLDRDGQAALLTSMLPGAQVPAGFSEGLLQATGGNPLFVQAALNVLLEEGHLTRDGNSWRFPLDPSVLAGLERVEASIQRRLAHLSPRSREVLDCAAVLGRQWTLCTLSAVTGLDEDALFCALEDLTHRQLLARGETGACHFPHDRVREVAHAALSPAARAALHLQAGEALAARSDADAHARELGRHFLEGGDDARAWRWLARAGHQALAAGASYTALEHFRDADQALARLPGDHLADQLPMWLLVGQHGFNIATGLAAQMLQRALAALEADPARVAEVLRPLGRSVGEIHVLYAAAMGLWGEPALALAAVAKLEAIAPRDGSPASAMPLVAALPALFVAGRLDATLARARMASSLLAGPLSPGTPALVHTMRVAAMGAQNVLAFQGLRPDPAIRDQALAYARELGDDDPYLPWFYFGVWAAWTGHSAELDVYLERTARKNRKLGGPPHVWLLYLAPYIRWLRGETEGALEQIERNLAIHPHLSEHGLTHMLARTLRGQLLLDLGRVPEAMQAFDTLTASARAKGLHLAWQFGLYGQGLCLIHAGRPHDAVPLFESQRDASQDEHHRNPLGLAYAHQGLGQAYMALGDPRSLGHLDTALAIAKRPEMDNLFQQAVVQHLRGLVLHGQGRQAEAVAALGEAGRLFGVMRSPHWLHRVHVDLARVRQAPPPPPLPATNAGIEARFERFKRLM
ncbi:MAG: protein kinase [Candidatus Sericytochromatia bacterium]|nr:protein kinase [Candidatus Sericytochromatia bacterium]